MCFFFLLDRTFDPHPFHHAFSTLPKAAVIAVARMPCKVFLLNGSLLFCFLPGKASVPILWVQRLSA